MFWYRLTDCPSRMTRDVLVALGRQEHLAAPSCRPGALPDVDAVLVASDRPIPDARLDELAAIARRAVLCLRQPRVKVVHLGLITGAVMRAHREHSELHDD